MLASCYHLAIHLHLHLVCLVCFVGYECQRWFLGISLRIPMASICKIVLCVVCGRWFQDQTPQAVSFSFGRFSASSFFHDFLCPNPSGCNHFMFPKNTNKSQQSRLEIPIYSNNLQMTGIANLACKTLCKKWFGKMRSSAVGVNFWRCIVCRGRYYKYKCRIIRKNPCPKETFLPVYDRSGMVLRGFSPIPIRILRHRYPRELVTVPGTHRYNPTILAHTRAIVNSRRKVSLRAGIFQLIRQKG